MHHLFNKPPKQPQPLVLEPHHARTTISTVPRRCLQPKREGRFLARSTLESFTEHEQLSLIVDREHTGAGDTTKNVGTCALEERPHAFCSNNLAGSVRR